MLPSNRYIINAHRGDINSTDGFPEDTLGSFLSAALKGAPMAKADVQLSADGTWYCMHDTTVDRTTNGTGHINTKTDAQVNALWIDGGLGYRSVHASTYHPPTLAAVLDVIKPYDMVLQIQCKDDDGSLEAILATWLLARGDISRVVINAGSQAVAQSIKAVSADFLVLSSVNVAETDIIEAEMASASLAVSLSNAPKPFSVYVDAVNYGSEDESVNTRLGFTYGCRVYTTMDLNLALAEYRKITMTDSVEAKIAVVAADVAGLVVAGGTPSFIGASVTHSATQNVANNTAVALHFDTEDYDTGGFHDPVTNNTRFTIPTDGVYRVTANVEYPANTTGFRDTVVRKNGTTSVIRVKQPPANSGSTAYCVTRDLALVAGDYLEVTALQTSGGTLTMAVNTNAQFFSIQLLG